jgi:hypothetical protein
MKSWIFTECALLGTLHPSFLAPLCFWEPVPVALRPGLVPLDVCVSVLHRQLEMPANLLPARQCSILAGPAEPGSRYLFVVRINPIAPSPPPPHFPNPSCFTSCPLTDFGWGTSLRNHWHLSPHLRVCFWETLWPHSLSLYPVPCMAEVTYDLRFPALRMSNVYDPLSPSPLMQLMVNLSLFLSPF